MNVRCAGAYKRTASFPSLIATYPAHSLIMSSHPKIDYVLFDVDGLMIDSEKIYTDVTSPSTTAPEIYDGSCVGLLLDEILSPYGVSMSWAIKAGCMGKRNQFPSNADASS